MANLPSHNPAPPMGVLPSSNPAPYAYNMNTPGAGSTDSQSIIDQLLAQIKGKDSPVPQGAADLGAVAGSFANDERMNRLTEGNFSQNYDQNMIAAQTGRNQNEDDALRKMAITGYLKSGGFKGGSPTIQLDGQQRTLPSYGSQPRPSSAAQVSSAGTLEDMLKQRLATGGSYMPQPLSNYATPGKAENISRIGGTVASGVGAIDNMLRKPDGSGGIPYGKIAGSVIDHFRNMK